jgi:hypothetical protein|nr:MAG TPA: hypothetical protein [Caudoviricetes sp.]
MDKSIDKKQELIELWERTKKRYAARMAPDSPFKKKYRLLTLRSYMK